MSTYMRSLLQKTIYALMFIGFLGLNAAVFAAYFVRIVDIQTGAVQDIFGRELTEAPIIASLIFAHASVWVGWAWFFGDWVIYWSVIGVLFLLFRFAELLEMPGTDESGTIS